MCLGKELSASLKNMHLQYWQSSIPITSRLKILFIFPSSRSSHLSSLLEFYKNTLKTSALQKKKKKGFKATHLLENVCFIDVSACREVVIETASLITAKWILVKSTNCPNSVMLWCYVLLCLTARLSCRNSIIIWVATIPLSSMNTCYC